MSEENQTTTQYNPSGADAPAPFTQGSLLYRSLLGENNGLLKTDAAAMTRTEPETDGRAPLCKGSSRAAGEGLYPILVRRPQGRERGKNTNIYEEPKKTSRHPLGDCSNGFRDSVCYLNKLIHDSVLSPSCASGTRTSKSQGSFAPRLRRTVWAEASDRSLCRIPSPERP